MGGKLPEVGKALGESIREFREGAQGLYIKYPEGGEEDTSEATPDKSPKA